MSNYSNTKATIAANVYTNANHEVTAAMVKTGINAVVDTLIAGGYLYKGVATTSTNPGTPDANIFYIATAAGTYTNLGGLVVNAGEVAILKYNGSWTKEVTGAATSAKLTELEQKVDDIGENVGDFSGPVDMSGIVNAIIFSTGNVDTNSAYRITNPISLKKGDTISFDIGTSNNYAALSKVMDNGGVLSYTPLIKGSQPSSNIIANYTYTADDDCDVAICYRNGYNNGGTIAFYGLMGRVADLESGKVDKIPGEGLINTEISEMAEIFSDYEERLKVETDSDGKILSYRDKSGRLHEPAGIDTKEINADAANFDELTLSANGMQAFQQSLINSGFNPGGLNDLSKETDVQIPLPRQCAKVNLICDHLPAYDGESIKGYIEFLDYDGNYFKKKIKKLKWQGDSSKLWHWKNYAFDLNDGSTLKFGPWVLQDSYHLKKFFADCIRGYSVVSYRIGEQVYQSRELGDRKPFEYLYANNSQVEGKAVFQEDFCTGALTHPDGFPIMLYHNGELMGLYAFCLKKDRANYNMTKKNADQIILDGALNGSTLFGGTIDWSAFELRNPGSLINMAGGEYDEGDEPIDSTSAEWDSSDADMVRSAAAKANVQRLANALGVIDFGNSGKSDADKKSDFESYFNLGFLIDYFLFANVIGHADGFNKNWIWCTWDNVLWSPTIYDCDLTFGNGNFYSLAATANIYGIASAGNETTPSHILWRLYKTELDARYKELRDNGIFDKENIVKIFQEWVRTAGYNNLKKDLEDCCVNSNDVAETPSYRDNNLKDGWILISAASQGYPAFDPTATYQSGDRCTYDTRYTLMATETIAPSDSPLRTSPYEYVPKYGGYHDSIPRIANWIEARIAALDTAFNY